MTDLVERLRFAEGLVADYSHALTKHAENAGDAVLGSDLGDDVLPVLGEAADTITRLRSLLSERTEALDDLQQAEFEYRQMHDRHGDGSQAAGRAWDLMRRAGDKARAALKEA